MELKVSSPKPGLSPNDLISDPEEKEISEDDDDDRNHKHRRREARSQSSDGDAPEILKRPFRKRNKLFENGHPFGSQSSDPWRSYNVANQEKDFSGRFEKRRSSIASYSRAPLDSNQRMRVNLSMSADPGSTRGRGRESGSWGQRNPRFSSVDIASQLVQPGSIPPNLFPGRGIPNVSNVQSQSWNAFGLVPAVPNGGLDTLHPIGLQGTLRPSMNPSMNLHIPLQRCRDFEERGFCLRGDMCPMEHGVNRIVVEDVQSLSQFNLPVSLPSAHLLGTAAGQGALPASASSSTYINSKVLHNKSTKSGMTDDGMNLNGAFVSSSVTGGADLYDPDQPLWANNPEKSSALLALNPSSVNEIEPFSDTDPPDNRHDGRSDCRELERPITNAGTAATSQSSSVWGRINSSKHKFVVRDKIDSALSSSNNLENETKSDTDAIDGGQGIARQEKGTSVDGVGPQAIGLSSKPLSNSERIIRKPSQKAFRTLFVSGIPHKENKREALFSHFRKFGEVIDIYIPLNSDRAFVQFSKREEAEAALKAPDAVMGNRFIKLRWANRDNIPEDGTSGVNNIPVNFRGVALAPSYPSATAKGKDNVQTSGPKSSVAHASDHSKPMLADGSKAPPPLQKKLSLELLKEELRKKREMLDQKRNEFRRQLSKLEKQASGVKDEVGPDPLSKKHKGGTLVGLARTETMGSVDSDAVSSLQSEMATERSRSVENAVTQSSKSNVSAALPDPSSLKPSIRPLAPLGAPFVVNRFKLDNRPTTFRILPPLPAGLANVSALKEHFSGYGDLSVVELEGFEPQEGDYGSEVSNILARISFTTRHSAERAFLNGKCWQGQNLQFTWLTSSNISKDNAVKENSSASSKYSSDANIPSVGENQTTSLQITPTMGSGESENIERQKCNLEHVDQEEDVKSDPAKLSAGNP